jgi:hypothetical protein
MRYAPSVLVVPNDRQVNFGRREVHGLISLKVSALIPVIFAKAFIL